MITKLDYTPKNGPNMLGEYSPVLREEMLGSYTAMAARAHNPDFQYRDEERDAGGFIVKAKESAVEAVNADLIHLSERQRVLHVTDHADHREHTVAVRRAAPKAVPDALIAAYDEILPPAKAESRKGNPSRTLLGSLMEIMAQSTPTPV